MGYEVSVTHFVFFNQDESADVEIRQGKEEPVQHETLRDKWPSWLPHDLGISTGHAVGLTEWLIKVVGVDERQLEWGPTGLWVGSNRDSNILADPDLWVGVKHRTWHDTVSLQLFLSRPVSDEKEVSGELRKLCKSVWPMDAADDTHGETVFARLRAPQPYIQSLSEQDTRDLLFRCAEGWLKSRPAAMRNRLDHNEPFVRDMLLNGSASLSALPSEDRVLDVFPTGARLSAWLALQIVEDNEDIEKGLDDLTQNELWQLEMYAHKAQWQAAQYARYREHLRSARRDLQKQIEESMHELTIWSKDPQHTTAQLDRRAATLQAEMTNHQLDLASRVMTAQWMYNTIQINLQNLASRRSTMPLNKMGDDHVYAGRHVGAARDTDQIKADLVYAESLLRQGDSVLRFFSNELTTRLERTLRQQGEEAQKAEAERVAREKEAEKKERDAEAERVAREKEAEKLVTIAVGGLAAVQAYGVFITILVSSLDRPAKILVGLLGLAIIPVFVMALRRLRNVGRSGTPVNTGKKVGHKPG